MRIHVLSDLHLELETWDAPATDSDLIVLAGDIGAHTHGVEWAARQSALAGKPILYVIGNHEYYGAEMMGLRKQIRLKADSLRAAGHKVFVLDNETQVIGGIRFLGSTLWTDYSLFGEGTEMAFAMSEAKRCMNDHSRIFFADRHAAGDDPPVSRSRLFRPQHAWRLHRYARAWLAEQLAQPHPGKTVVVTHHLPSKRSVAARFASQILPAAFASNMDQLVELADLWVHGHTHDAFDYRIGKCHVVCNPRGYPSETNSFRPSLVVEV
jgi:predicted phosphodiesterase